MEIDADIRAGIRKSQEDIERLKVARREHRESSHSGKAVDFCRTCQEFDRQIEVSGNLVRAGAGRLIDSMFHIDTPS